MHTAPSPQSDGTDRFAAEPPDAAAVHVSAAGSPAELSVLERLEAFRELIRHGHSLLGEVVAYCREAETAVNQLEAEKQDLDRLRTELQQARRRADEEAAAARTALAQVEAQRRELNAMREDLVKAQAEIEQFRETQRAGAAALEVSLRDAKQQQRQLELELQRVRAQTASSQAIDARLGQLDAMQARLRTTERELADTRSALEAERSRRDRAIALIKPKEVRP